MGKPPNTGKVSVGLCQLAWRGGPAPGAQSTQRHEEPQLPRGAPRTPEAGRGSTTVPEGGTPAAEEAGRTPSRAFRGSKPSAPEIWAQLQRLSVLCPSSLGRGHGDPWEGLNPQFLPIYVHHSTEQQHTHRARLVCAGAGRAKPRAGAGGRGLWWAWPVGETGQCAAVL